MSKVKENEVWNLVRQQPGVHIIKLRLITHDL